MSATRTLLYVDDERENLFVFEATFGDDYEVLTAPSAEEGLEILASRDVPVVVSDQRMPGTSGVQFLSEARRRCPDGVRMILTAYTDVADVISAINDGHVYRFLTKPWEPAEMGLALKHAFEAYELARANRTLTEELLRKERLATVGRLVSGLAHEIQNQLNVRGFADAILARYPEDAYLKERVSMIRNALTVISGMVREIRDFSRGAAAKPAAPRATHDLAALARRAVALLEHDPDVARVALDAAALAGAPVPVACHPEKLEQVVINLVRNAAQATRGREAPSVAVAALAQGAEAVLRVADNGCGISPENLERIFEPFFSTKDEGGMGLGLHICRAIVEAHGGRIVCASEPERGATFELRVPLAAAVSAS